MFRLIVLSVLALSTTAAGADLLRQVSYRTEGLTPTNTTPTFDRGYLVVYGIGSATVYKPDGSLAYSIPGPEHGVILNVAVDTDRTAAAVISRGDKRVIALFDQAGSQVRLLDTGQYRPAFVCFAPDHSIWVTGAHLQPNLSVPPDSFVLRHFSRDGKELGAFLPRSSFESSLNPVEAVQGLSGLRIANGRIGVLVNHAVAGAKPLWVETDLNGKELGRWRVDLDGNPAAFTPGGNVYARGVDGVSVLDRGTGKWSLVSTAVPPDGILIGSDGEALVFMTRGTPELRWLAVDRN
jgi:hypothetical protein